MALPVLGLRALEAINLVGAGASVTGTMISAMDKSTKTTNQLLAIINQTLTDGFNGLNPQSEALKRAALDLASKIQSGGSDLKAAREEDKRSYSETSFPDAEKKVLADLVKVQNAFFHILQKLYEIEGIPPELLDSLKKDFDDTNAKAGPSEYQSKIQAYTARSRVDLVDEVASSRDKFDEENSVLDLTAFKTSITEALAPLKDAIEQIDLCGCEAFSDKADMPPDKEPIALTSTPAFTGLQNAVFLLRPHVIAH